MIRQLTPTLSLLFALLGLSFTLLAAEDYTLGAGDVIKITVFDYPDLATETRVSESGTITFPLLGEVRALDLSPASLAARIEKELSRQNFIRQPHVTVNITQFVSQQVSVIGEVYKPGKFYLEKSSTISDLIAQAGGVNPTGGDKAVITRASKEGGKRDSKIEVDLYALFQGDQSKDIEILAGDMIYVPKSPVFFIYGEVQHPGMYRLERNMTVAQAISVGGGLTPRGTDSDVKVKRPDQQGEIQANPIELGERVKPDDVIFVRESWF